VTRLRQAWLRIAPVVDRWSGPLRVVGFFVSVAIVVVMGVLAARDVPFHSLRWSLLAPALLAAAVWWVSLTFGWSLLAVGSIDRSQISLWCRTQSLRYLPGGFWGPASRVLATGGSALDRVSTVAAENAVSLACALSIGGLALGVTASPWWLALTPTAVLPVVASGPLRSRTRLEPRRVTWTTVTCLVGFASYAGAAVLAQGAVSGIDDPLRIAGAAAIAWSAGLVVIFAPGGIGARELVYVGVLGGTTARADLAAAALTLRVLTIVCELAVLLVVGRPRAGRRISESDVETEILT
jgi:hypothetical protein